jgi:hypothetical protein
MLTKGWDTISIIKQDTINSELRNTWGSVDSSISYTIYDDEGTVNGKFAPWQIIEGGGGRLLRMELPIEQGNMEVNNKSFDLDGISIIIGLTLTLMPQADKSILKTQYAHITKSPSDIPDDNEGWIVPITITGDNGTLGAYKEVLLDSICDYLIKNPEQLILTFAEIRLVQDGCPDWLLPKRTAYSYLDTGYLCVLAVCDDRSITDLPLDIDVSGLTSGSDSYFVVSSKTVLKNMILPSVISLYENASINDFDVQDLCFYNTRELDMHDVKSGAIYYTPVVRSGGNQGEIVGDEIAVYYDGYCDMYLGIDMYWKGYVKMSVSLNNGVISFNKVDDNFSHDEDIPWYLKWLSLAVMAITEIVVAIISDDLIDKIKEQSSSIDTSNINTVEWFGVRGNVTAANLNESLILQYT